MFQEHLSNLSDVFIKFCELKLRANREKSNFVCEKVKYLGHHSTMSGLKVDPGKTADIQNMLQPGNVK